MIFRNFAFIALVVASSTLNCASADRTKLRGRWQVDDAKDASVDDAAVDIAGTATDAGLKRRRRRRQRRELKKKEKKGSASSDSTDVGGGGKKKKNDKNAETGMYAGTFNYAAVRPTAWNPSAVTLGSAQTNTNYASPGAATGNMAAGNAVVSSAGVYRPPQQQQQPEPEPEPVINNNVPAPVYTIYNYAANTNQQQQQAPPVVVSSTPPVTNTKNDQGNAPGKVVATSANRGINNQAVVPSMLCSIRDGCCSSSQCATGCCNFNYGCTNVPTQSWMAKYADSFCM